MKFVSLFAVGAVASLLPRAEIDTISSDIQTIRDAVQAFTSTMSDYSESDMTAVRTDLRNIILAINAADSDCKALKGPFSDKDATALATPIQDLGIDLGKAVDALIAAKPALVSGCHGPEIYQALVDQNMQSQAFQADLMKRLSTNVQTLASQMAKPANSNIAKAVASFFDQQNVKCSAPKVSSTSSIYGAIPMPTGSQASPSPASSGTASPSPAASNPNSDTQSPNTNTGLLTGPSIPNTNSNTQQNSNTASNSTATISVTSAPIPTSSIVQGSASTVGATLGFAGIVALAFFLL